MLYFALLLTLGLVGGDPVTAVLAPLTPSAMRKYITPSASGNPGTTSANGPGNNPSGAGQNNAGSGPGNPGNGAVILDSARLRELLFHRDRPQEQSQAALILIQSDAAEAQALVQDALRRWDRPDVFQAVTAAIRLWRDPRYVQPLLRALAADQAPIRQMASEALAGLDPNATVRWLFALAEDAQSPLLARQSAATTLGRIPHKMAVKALLSLLTTESPGVRQAAAQALEDLSGCHYGTDLGSWQAWWQPYRDMPDQEWLAQRTIYFADRARRLGDELQRAEQAILQLHRTLYARTPANDRLSHLATLAQSEYAVVRMQAIGWLLELVPEGNAADKKAVADLLLLLSRDGVEAVQRQAVLALERIDEPRAFERLLELLVRGQPLVRAAAARSLGRCRQRSGADGVTYKQRALLALEEALGDPHLAVVASAAESLGSLDYPEAAPILAGLLRHHADVVRQAAAAALEQNPSARVLSAIFTGLEDPVPGVRFSLVAALGKIGQREVLDDSERQDLLRRLERVLVLDTDPGVRSRAATVLGDLGDAGQLPLLWQRTRATEDNRVQIKAWQALTDILARLRNVPLLMQWEQLLIDEKETARRIELFGELRDRWSKQEETQLLADVAAGCLIRAWLADRKWAPALPVIHDLVRRARSEAERAERLRWLLIACSQALDDKQPQEVHKALKQVEELLPQVKELAADFAELRRKAQELSRP